MRKNLLLYISALLVCVSMPALTGCGSGSASRGSSTYTLGGTVAGLGANQSVSLQDNGGDTLPLNANGAFSFPMSLNPGSAYAVTAQSHTPGVACSVDNGSGTVGSSNVTAIDVTCTAGTEKIFYSFGASAGDGSGPAGLIMDSAGNLYGTTYKGGAYGNNGTVFKISSTGAETVLHSFGASAGDGRYPQAGLIMDSAGNLYGTTSYGGANGDGTVFKIASTGAETILYSFGASAGDGANPAAGLIMDSAGNLYGTTYAGGANNSGTVFKISSTGSETVLHSFGASAGDGANPYAGLIMDSAGNFYGTTYNGGANGYGTVFKISSTGSETVLYSFNLSAGDGTYPDAGLIMDSAGNLYGTTSTGGAYNNNGTVFKIASTGAETVLHSFGASIGDGVGPQADLIMDSAGNLYGTTGVGGAYNGSGTVFKIASTGAETVLHTFGTSAGDGRYPQAGLIMDSAGNLYGTTSYGGANGDGTVFVID